MSLAPSGTDLVCALGLGSALVGVSHSCDSPEAKGLPVVTRSSITPASPAEIDRAVSEAWRQGQPLYVTDAELVRSLAPTVLIAQDVCDVCAVDGSAAAAILPDGARLVRLGASSIAGLYADLTAVADACGVSAASCIEDIRERLAAVERAVAGAPRPRVVVLEWGDPPFSAGHWVPELIAIAGGEERLGEPGRPSRRIEGRAILEADPDLILYAPCGYALDAAVTEAREVLRRREAQAVPATRRGDVWALDASRLLSRCTPAVARAAEVLAAVLHPDRVGPPTATDAIRLHVTA